MSEIQKKLRGLIGPLVILACVPQAGCQSLSLSREEWAWQTLHMVDIAQTANAARDPCYIEDALITQELIGKQPSTTDVLLWGAGISVGHAWISHLLEDRGAPKWVQKTWSYATLTSTGLAVATNHAEGVRAFGDNQPVDGCYR